MKFFTTRQKIMTAYLCFFALATCSHLHGFMREGFQKPTPAIAQRKTSQNPKDVKAAKNNVMTELLSARTPTPSIPSPIKNVTIPPTQKMNHGQLAQSPTSSQPTSSLKLPQTERQTLMTPQKTNQNGVDALVEAPLVSVNGTNMVVKRQPEAPVQTTQSQGKQPHPTGTTLLTTPFNKKPEPFVTIEEPLTQTQVHQEAANLLHIYNLGGINKPQEILTSLHKDLARLKKENPSGSNERSIVEKAIDTQENIVTKNYTPSGKAQQKQFIPTVAQTKAFFANAGNQVKTFFGQTLPATFRQSRFSQQPEKAPLTAGTHNSAAVKPSGPTLRQKFSNLTQDAVYKTRDFINNTETVLVRDAQGKTIKKERSYYDDDPLDPDYDVSNRYEETNYSYNPQGKLQQKAKTSFVTNPKNPDNFIAEERVVTDIYNNGKESSVAIFTPKLSRNGNIKLNKQGNTQFQKMPSTITQFKRGTKTSETELFDTSSTTMTVLNEDGTRTHYPRDPQYVNKKSLQVHSDYDTPYQSGSSLRNITIPSHLKNPQPVLNSFGQIVGFKESAPRTSTERSTPLETPVQNSSPQPAQPTPADKPAKPTPLYEPLVQVDRGYKKPVKDWRV